jgi:serine/threonine-protein kinase
VAAVGDKKEVRFGQVLDGRYQLGREIGRGAMGIVYEALHTRLDRRVAIKILLHELAEDADACERFEREARAASRIGNRHIVDVLDAGELGDGRRYLVLEYLAGETLRERYARLGPLDPEALFPLLEQLIEGIAAAHDAGIVHRDVKPDNVFLVGSRDDPEPLVKILDFGVSKFRDVGTNALKSRTGVVLGTPHYMAPEQARGLREVDRRADVYSVGVLAYEGLCGRRPFHADNVNQLLFSIALDDVPRLEERVAGVDPAVSAIVARATRREPAERYQSARELVADVRAWLDGEPLHEHTQALVGAPAGGGSDPPPPVDDEPTAGAPMATFLPQASESPSPPVAPAERAPLAALPLQRRRWPLLLAGAVAIGAGLVAFARAPAAQAWAPAPAALPSHGKRASRSASAPVAAPAPQASAAAAAPPLPRPSVTLRPGPLPAPAASAASSPQTPRPFRKDL